jgi:DNA-binding response OmpR family regulator
MRKLSDPDPKRPGRQKAGAPKPSPTSPTLLPCPRLDDDEPGTSQGSTILLVEDQPTVRLLVKQTLVQAGYTVVEAGDGEVAMGLLETRSFDLVLLDVRMPGMDGIEVCTEIRRRWDSLELPVIFTTGLADRQARVWCKAVGGDEFLTKPIDATELLIRVGNLLKLHRDHRKLVLHNEYLEDLVGQRAEQVRSVLHEVRRHQEHVNLTLEGTRGRLAELVEGLGELAMQMSAETGPDSPLVGALLSRVEELDAVHGELTGLFGS